MAMSQFSFTPAQLEQYFERIRLPPQSRINDVSRCDEQQTLDYLELLTTHHLANIPFENLTLHYSWHRVVGVDPLVVLKKMTAWRGGYCMENNTLFHTVLVSLGFEAYMIAARVYMGDKAVYGALDHCATIILIGDVKYLVDVGFGPNTPTVPLRLTEDRPHERKTDCPGAIRFSHETITQGVARNDKYWVYQVLSPGDDAKWQPQYCFKDVEFFNEDLRRLNVGPNTLPTSLFVKSIICSRFTLDNEDYDEQGRPRESSSSSSSSTVTAGPPRIRGVVMLQDDKIKWRDRGEVKFRKALASEEERIEAFQQYFGITLAEEERRAIAGTAKEIVSQAETTPNH